MTDKKKCDDKKKHDSFIFFVRLILRRFYAINFQVEAKCKKNERNQAYVTNIKKMK